MINIIQFTNDLTMLLLHLGFTTELLVCRKDMATTLTYFTTLTEFIKQSNEM
jgi:hypothetical protein